MSNSEKNRLLMTRLLFLFLWQGQFLLSHSYVKINFYCFHSFGIINFYFSFLMTCWHCDIAIAWVKDFATISFKLLDQIFVDKQFADDHDYFSHSCGRINVYFFHSYGKINFYFFHSYGKINFYFSFNMACWHCDIAIAWVEDFATVNFEF